MNINVNDIFKKKIEKTKEEMFCQNCGNDIKIGNKYCEKCGEMISENYYKNLGGKNEKDLDENKKSPNKILEETKENDFTIDKEILLKNIDEPNNNSFSCINNSQKEKHTIRNFKKKEVTLVIISAVITLLVCMIFTITYCNYFVNINSEVETVSKDVTITDTGIAEAVAKVYDAVVVVETYVKGQLYSTGTGFVYKTDDKYGYILTNNHVIEDGTEIKVVFTDSTEETVVVVGTDSYSDIAVLAVDKVAVLSVVEIGSSEDIEVGDTTFAVGAPLDSAIYSWTVTRGILSGKNRLVEVATSSSSYSSSSSYIMEVLQTDTAINSGNSGGPLCNANGEVIGITNMKISSSSVEGMGFAIPIETAIEYAEMFISGEAIVRPYLGISMYDMSSTMLGNTTGIYVASVESGSPAANSGLEKGDIITKIGDIDIESSSYLKYELYKYEIGDEVSFTYTRNSKEYTATITLGSTSTS